jgi:exodeoxyribonuclease V gamma subunit
LDRLRAALDSPPVPDPGQARDVIRISLGDLRTFLECPLSGAAAVRLGLRNRELEDRTAVADERFESDSLATWSLLRTTALATLNGAGSPEEVYGQGLRRLQARGGAPYGLFSEVATEAHLGTIRGWLAHLQSAHPAVRPTTWHLGAPRPGVARVDHSHPPLVFTVDLGGRPCRVELAGPLTVQLEGSLFLQSGTRPGPGGLAGIRKKALAAFIDHQVLACIDPDHGEHRARFVYESPVGNPPQQERAFRFPALTPESGRLRLQSWIEDLLTGDPAVLLPIEAVLDGWVDRSLSPGSILDYVDNAINGSRPARFSTLYGPVPDPTRFPPPADPMGIMTARLGDYLDRVCAAEPAEPKEEA